MRTENEGWQKITSLRMSLLYSLSLSIFNLNVGTIVWKEKRKKSRQIKNEIKREKPWKLLEKSFIVIPAHYSLSQNFKVLVTKRNSKQWVTICTIQKRKSNNGSTNGLSWSLLSSYTAIAIPSILKILSDRD